MDTPRSVTNTKIQDSSIPLKTTQPQGLIHIKRDDDDTAPVILHEPEESDGPSLDCNDDDTDLAVARDGIPFGKCCTGDDDKRFDNARHDKADGCKKSLSYASDNHEPCRQVITNFDQDKSLTGSSARMSPNGGLLHVQEGTDGTEDNCGSGRRGQGNDEENKPRYKIHRANAYAYRHKDGTIYNVQIKSQLGEELPFLLGTAISVDALPISNGVETRDITVDAVDVAARGLAAPGSLRRAKRADRVGYNRPPPLKTLQIKTAMTGRKDTATDEFNEIRAKQVYMRGTISGIISMGTLMGAHKVR
ncbi:unnamed protein product [Clonostachys rosea]|uniref:Uncharacterized protein n=1 Tax=Bionectria ochroleuca TaxID=29856 RepID=A0ABY6TZL8_BIOOC|nr:unnamed protein product [Clonostachys rosea]